MKLEKIKIRNKRGQREFSPAIFIVGIIVLIIMAPIILKVISSVRTGITDALNDTEPKAIVEMNYGMDKVVGFIDYLLILMFFVSLIILFISAYFIDTNPIFLVLYIIFAFIFILLLPNMMEAVDTVWSKFPVETNSLPLTGWIQSNMVMFTLGVFILTGIIMYAKFKFGGTTF